MTGVEAALGIRPTWHNGGIETFGPSGSVIAAMIAVASGLARHVLCYRTVWEATHNELMRLGEISPPAPSRTPSWMFPFGRPPQHTLSRRMRSATSTSTAQLAKAWVGLR